MDNLVKGGQGRSDESVMDSGVYLLGMLVGGVLWLIIYLCV